MRDSILGSLDEPGPQNGDCNGGSGSKQVIGLNISPDADHCLASSLSETTTWDCEYDKNLAMHNSQHIEEKTEDCDANGGSVLDNTKKMFLAHSSLMGPSEGNSPHPAVDMPYIDEGDVNTPGVPEVDGKFAMENRKRESLHLLGEAEVSVATNSQVTCQTTNDKAGSTGNEGQFIVKLRRESSKHLFSVEKLDSGDIVGHECHDSTDLIESSDLHLPNGETHDQTVLEMVHNVDGNPTSMGEQLHQSTDAKTPLPGENMAVMVRKDCQLPAEESTSDPYYFSDGDEQTADTDSKPATKWDCSSQNFEVEGRIHEGDKAASPSDHARVVETDGQIKLHNINTAISSSQIAKVESTFQGDKTASTMNDDGKLGTDEVNNANGSGQVAEAEGTSHKAHNAASPINHKELNQDGETQLCSIDTVSGSDQVVQVESTFHDRDKAASPIDPGGQLDADRQNELLSADTVSDNGVCMRGGGTCQASDHVDFFAGNKVISLKIDGQSVVESKREASNLCPGMLSSEQAGLQSVDVALGSAVTRYEVSQQGVVKEGTDLADDWDFVVQNPPETFKFYFRKRKRSRQDHTLVPDSNQVAGSAATGQTLLGSTDGEPSTAIKCYTRRSRLTALESLADAATMTEGCHQNSGPQTSSTGKGGKVTPFVLRSRNRLNTSAKAVSQDKHEPIHDDNMMSKRKSPAGGQQNHKKGFESTKMARTSEKSNSTSQLIEQPDWLPKGWTTEVKVRGGGHTAGTKDKYYHDPVSGRRFRSKNEVMQFLGSGTLERWHQKPKFNSKLSGQKTVTKVQSQNAPTKLHSQSAPSKLSTQKTQEPLSSHHLPARMKITPVTAKPSELSQPIELSQPCQPSLPAISDPPSSLPASNSIPPPVTWAPVFGPHGPIWLPWGGSIAQIQEAQRAGTPLVGTGGTNIAHVSSSSQGVSTPSSKDQEQKDTENRGKLIFRLKRKHPEQEHGKGKSKRPMYEIVGRENASSSTSMPNPVEQQKIMPNIAGQENPTSASTPTQEENATLMKESLDKSLTHDYLSNMLKEESIKKSTEEPAFRMTKRQRPLLPKWNAEQSTAWTALGIPATASASGLQQMSQFRPNRLFWQQPSKISTFPTWQYPLSSHMPTVAPTPARMAHPGQMSSVPLLPVSASIPAAPNRPTASFSFFPSATVPPSDYCNESGVGSLKMELAGAATSDRVSLAHRTMVLKPLTKVATMKQLEGLGRHICQQGLESVQQPRNPKFSLEDISATLEGSNVVSGVQRLPSSLVVEDLQKTPQAA